MLNSIQPSSLSLPSSVQQNRYFMEHHGETLAQYIQGICRGDISRFKQTLRQIFIPYRKKKEILKVQFNKKKLKGEFRTQRYRSLFNELYTHIVGESNKETYSMFYWLVHSKKTTNNILGLGDVATNVAETIGVGDTQQYLEQCLDKEYGVGLRKKFINRCYAHIAEYKHLSDEMAEGMYTPEILVTDALHDLTEKELLTWDEESKDVWLRYYDKIKGYLFKELHIKEHSIMLPSDHY